MADNPYFQELIQTAQSKSNVHMVNHKNIREQLREMAISAKEDLMTSDAKSLKSEFGIGWLDEQKQLCMHF